MAVRVTGPRDPGGDWTTTSVEFYGPWWPDLAEELDRHASALVYEADRYGIDRAFRRWA